MKKLMLLFSSLIFPLLLSAQNSDFERAEKALDAENLDSAFIYLNRNLNIYPENWEALCYRSFIYYTHEKNDSAILDVNKVIRYAPSNDKAFNAYAFYLRGCIYSKNGNDKNAIADINKALKLNPHNVDYYVERAKLYNKMHKYSSAISDYSKAIELNKDSSLRLELLNFRADSYSNAGLFEQSIADYNAYASLDSTNAYIIGRRGEVKRMMGDYNNAITDYTKAIAQKPNEEWFYYRRGWVKDKFMKDHENGLSDYNQAILVNGNYAYSYLERALLHESYLLDTIKAKADLERVLNLDTVVYKGWNCRQYALFYLGRNQEAISWMNKIIEQYPNKDNYYDAACLYSLMNKQFESLKYLDLALNNGFNDYYQLLNTSDLDNIRCYPKYKSLMKVCKKFLNSMV